MTAPSPDAIGVLLRATRRLPLPAAAAAWASAGHPVFPCVPGEKQPLTTHGFQNATTDARRVARWWRRWPRANIGLATGTTLDVVDIDERSSGSGFTAVAAADRAGLLDGWIAAVRTPNHGLHLYYPAQAGGTSWSLARQHVDFRAAGGYILVPPSTLTDDSGSRRYTLGALRQSGHPIDGERVREFLRPPTLARTRPTDAVIGGIDIDRISTWLTRQPEGNRNHALFWAGCRLAEHGVALPDALGALGPAAATAGLGDREIDRTLQSAYRTVGHGSALTGAAAGPGDRGTGIAR
ncbi:bifunctional DNA primase/polymerase [Microbacterium rhizophilus]|uniref:bifunctional DNA primase/polymerase n=1 Tax=Microbacterium rhizophilus TaxID=3138934 RepID=UPI0031EFF161